LSFASRVENAPKRFITIDEVFTQLGDESEKRALESMLYDNAWTTPKVFEALRDEGFMVSENHVRAWRRAHDVR